MSSFVAEANEVVVIGATNRMEDLDSAVIRRLFQTNNTKQTKNMAIFFFFSQARVINELSQYDFPY